MTRKRRLGIVMSNGWSLKTFVYSGVIDLLSKDFDICVWAQEGAIPSLREDSTRGEIAPIKVYPIQPTKETGLEKAVRQLHKSVFAERYRLETEEVKKRSIYPTHQRIAANLLGGPSRTPLGALAIHLLQKARQATVRRNFYASHFDDFKPEALMLGHPVENDEWVVAVEAHDRRIPVLSYVLSWDNLSSKGVIPDFFKGVLVWNETMRQEVRDYYPNYRP